MSETFTVKLDRFMRLSSMHTMREYGMELAAEGAALEAKLDAVTRERNGYQDLCVAYRIRSRSKVDKALTEIRAAQEQEQEDEH